MVGTCPSAPHDGRLHTGRDASTACRWKSTCLAAEHSLLLNPLVIPVRSGGGECFGLLWHKR